MERPRLWPVVLAAGVATVAVHAGRFVRPMIQYDDFDILARSWTWPTAWANVWVPQNEHAMPLGRLTTAALVQAAGPVTAVPLALAFQAPLAVLAGMALVGVFLRRETASRYNGLLGLVLFGVTSCYREAVTWFAASFAILSVDTFLLALLAAQEWRRTGRVPWLVGSAVAAALAPGWFALGVLAGPLCGLYLLATRPRTAPVWQRWLGPAVPAIGTAAFLAVSLPRTAEHVSRLLRADGRWELLHGAGSWESSVIVRTAVATLRSLVDHLAFNVLGFGELFACPPALVVVVVAGLAWAAVRWWRQAPHRGLLALGLGLIFSSLVLIYVGRAHLEYQSDGMYEWSRYALMPYLGLVFYVVGGLPRPEPADTEAVSPRQRRMLWLLIGILFLIQAPRGLATSLWYDPEQRPVLERIAAVDDRCRAHGIAAAAAREVLPPLPVPAGGADGWVFLRGSPRPRPLAADEVRRLLSDQE